MALGIIWAILSGMYGMNKFTADWIDPFGKIFINCLKFIAVPLVLFSIVTGVAGLGDPSRLGRMGYKTLGLYLFTTVFAVSVGLVIANFSGVGLQNDEDTRLTNRLKYEIWATDNQVEIMDDRFEMATANPLKVEQVRAKLNAEAENADPALMLKTAEAKSNLSQGPLQPLIDLVPDNLVKALGDGRLMLQVIFFALLFGIAMVLLPTEKTSTVRSFFDNMNDIFIKMVHMIMRAAPFFVFCLMAGVLAKSADSIPELLSIFADLGAYALAVVIGLALMLFLFYPMLLRLFGVRIGYRDFFRGLSPALFLAFSTSSSAATLPVTIECANDNLKIPEQATDFVLPIGATVNMDGTSLYQALAVIFLAHYYDVDLSLMQQLGIVVTATLASIGAAAVPGAGLIMLMIVLDSTGLNPMWVALIMPMDRILDMCRTVVNVCSDVTVSAIIAKSEKMEI